MKQGMWETTTEKTVSALPPEPKQLVTAHRKAAAVSSRHHLTVVFADSIQPAASQRQRGASVESGKS